MIRFVVVAISFGIRFILAALGLLEQLLNQLQLLCGQAFARELDLSVTKDRFGDHLTAAVATGIVLVIDIISDGSGGSTSLAAVSVGGLCIDLSLSVMVLFVSP